MTRILAAVLTLTLAQTALAQQQPTEPAQPAAEETPTPGHPPARVDQPVSPTPTTVTAPEKKESWTDRISMFGKAYLRYSWTLDNPQNPNEFAIDRVYVQSSYKFTDKLSALVTLEAAELRDSTGYFDVALKHLYLEAKDLGLKDSYLRVGQVGTAWVPFQEDLWGLRLQSPMMTDRFGYMTSTDLGIAYGGKLPSGFGSYQVSVLNGEGWKKKEQGKRKAAEARLTVNPLASVGGLAGGLFLSGFAYYGGYDDADFRAHNKERYLAQAGLRTKNVYLAAEYGFFNDAADALKKRYTLNPDNAVARGQGLSVLGVLGFGAFSPSMEGFDLFARFDRVDPDTTLADNEVGLLVVGAGWKWNKYVRTIVNYDRNLAFAAPAGATPDHALKIQMEVKL